MATQTAFEVQCFKNGRWEIRSIFDDGRTALAEADRLERRGIKRLRVVQERMDGNCELIHSRTIYQTGTVEQPAAPSAKAKSAPRPKAAAQQQDEPVARTVKSTRKVQDKDSWPRILATTAVLLVCAVGALVLLRSF